MKEKKGLGQHYIINTHANVIPVASSRLCSGHCSVSNELQDMTTGPAETILNRTSPPITPYDLSLLRRSWRARGPVGENNGESSSGLDHLICVAENSAAVVESLLAIVSNLHPNTKASLHPLMGSRWPRNTAWDPPPVPSPKIPFPALTTSMMVTTRKTVFNLLSLFPLPTAGPQVLSRCLRFPAMETITHLLKPHLSV